MQCGARAVRSRMTGTWRGRVPHRALATVLALVSAACSPGHGPPPALVDDTPNGYAEYGYSQMPSEVLLLGVAPLRVVAPAELESVAFEGGNGAFELLAARAIVTDGRYAGAGCGSGPWPPQGYGGTDPLAGFAVDAGDRVSVVLYFRARKTPAATEGIRLTYRDATGSRRTVTINERIVVDPPRADERPCPSRSGWFAPA